MEDWLVGFRVFRASKALRRAAGRAPDSNGRSGPLHQVPGGRQEPAAPFLRVGGLPERRAATDGE